MADLLHISENENNSIHYVFALNKAPLDCIHELQALPGFDTGLLLVSYAMQTGGTACYVCSPSDDLTPLENENIIYCSFVRCLYLGSPLDFSINFKNHLICFDYEKIDPSLEQYIISNL